MSRRARRVAWAAGIACLVAACTAQPSGARRTAVHDTCTPAEAWAATRGGQWDLAAARWNELFRRGGAADPVACREAARALVEVGDSDGALEVLLIGLEQSPGHPDLLETHGNVLADMGFRRAAEHSFEDALVAAPDRVSALRSLGRVRLGLDRAAAALTPLERCLELGVADTETRLLHARALACAGRTEEALAAFVGVLDAEEVTAADLVGAAALLCQEREVKGCRRRCRAWLERAVELDPTCADAYFELGRLRAGRDQHAEAAAAWRRAIANDPDHVAALERLAEWCTQRGDDMQAAHFTRRAAQAAKRPRR